MWMWGDIIGKHPELLENMPKDITVLEWGYEAEHPFLKNTKRIDKAGLPFLVCPGTSSWMTLTGRTDNMLGNIENAIQSAVTNGGMGVLLTDWGVMGHWQYLPVSYPGIAYAGAVSWNSRSSRIVPLERYLNTHIFEGSDPALAGIVMNIGRSYHFEERHLPNSSHNFLAYQFGIMDPVLEATIFEMMRKKLPELVGDSAFNIMAHRFDDKKPFKYEALGSYLNGLESDLNARIGEMDLQPNYLETDTLVRHEVRNGIAMVRLGASVRQYSQQKTSWSSEERIQFLSMMEANLSQLKEEHQRLWLERNKSGGLERSMEAMDKLELQIKDQLEIEQGSAVRRSANEFKDKVIAGGASWYLSD